MTLAAIAVRRALRPLDGPLVRLTVHHATIFELNVESYSRRSALDRTHRSGKPANPATSTHGAADAERQSG